MKLKFLKTSSGFTLIELLTVISIISVLTALLTVSFVSVSQRGRDGQRKSNIRQIQSALELYRSDNDSYPSAAVYNAASCNGQFPATGNSYMTKFPCDPEGTNVKYYYLPGPSSTCAGTALSPCSTYTLASCIDNSGDKEAVGSSGKPSTMGVCSPAYYFVAKNP